MDDYFGFDWQYDRAASGERLRTRVGKYQIVAYFDGRWFVDNSDVGYAAFAEGEARSLEWAQRVAVAVAALHAAENAG